MADKVQTINIIIIKVIKTFISYTVQNIFLKLCNKLTIIIIRGIIMYS